MERRSAESPPLGSRAIEPGLDALADDVALELGHRADDREHRLADGARGVELLLERDEGHVQAAEGVERRHEVLHTASEPIEAPHEHGLELPGPRRAHEAIESGPGLLRPRE